mgnify:CR=1 FL=1|jgi:hypothetical protein
MNNKQHLKELYKLFLVNLTGKNTRTRQNKKQIIKCIENYLDKSVLQNYESKYNTFVYIYNIENNKI